MGNSLIDFEAAFHELDGLLGLHHQTLHIIVCGGYLIQRMGFRGTIDVDAFYTASEEITLLIERVGLLLNINTGKTIWLNNAVSTMSDWPDPQYCEPLFAYENLTVEQVTMEYLLGMKLSSIRDVDAKDAGKIVEMARLDDPLALYQQCRAMGLKLSFVAVLEAFTFAYGDEWRAQYWNEHDQEILSLLNVNW
ncbi:MAG: hypothetical protein FWE40_07155 [Oscillospiraceae bacterium]|nr:hypothetical protein [Oscillospiraceae bacterium]